LIEGGHYPFNETIQDELKQCQQEENLTDKEVDEISNPILEAAEKLRQQQEFEHCSYRVAFIDSISPHPQPPLPPLPALSYKEREVE
jgi:hypothetical protein